MFGTVEFWIIELRVAMFGRNAAQRRVARRREDVRVAGRIARVVDDLLDLLLAVGHAEGRGDRPGPSRPTILPLADSSATRLLGRRVVDLAEAAGELTVWPLA